MQRMKLLTQAFTVLHGLTAVLFACAALLLMAAAVHAAWSGLTEGIGSGAAQEIMEAMGLLAAAVVALQISQTIVEEEVQRGGHVSGPTRVRRFLSRFFVVVTVALAIEALVSTFRAVHENPSNLLFSAALLAGTALLVGAWGAFVHWNRRAEELEPEAMREVKSEDQRLKKP